MGRRVTTATISDTVDLAPEAFAELLGLSQSDAPYLATAPVRLPRAWVDGWRDRTGVRELAIDDLVVVLGVSKRTVLRYLAKGSRPCISHRLGASPGAHRGRLTSPANLVLFLRERSRLAGVVPAIRETRGQRDQRGSDAQKRAIDLCGG